MQKMRVSRFWVLLLVSCFFCKSKGAIVPALIMFGDSIVDVGNNNNLLSIVKSNFPPYGRDFTNQTPTGRFCNGKLAVDFAAEYLGFSSYPPAFLSREARNEDFLIGANFASASSGYYDATSVPFGAISLTRQLSYYRMYQNRVRGMIGRERARTMFSKSIHILSAGSSDFLQNYYVNPLLNILNTPEQFSDILMRSYSEFIQNLYELGARRIGVISLPPMGCLPAAITLFGAGNKSCVERLNNDAIMFNTKLETTTQTLMKRHSGLKLVAFNAYQPLMDIITNPYDNGFFETKRACCGTGTIETSFLCNSLSLGTCSNATGYMFWDGFHPTEAVYELLAGQLLSQGISLIS
ncbi:GDSL esterase/lipase At3g53100 [Raphanus sativus]|uniref:GDSL esterase/lipase At3g53100 n=1 Tax=Raphanus sativus TaxID=3726 RepID=A0A6J0NGR8_RAPSA|nr:GDSL esterase/lipase At3g53100 [Raphanus sativus]XP_056855790.1 GDSL esterase/lipase At3g53100 [Raphanus sativus]